MTRHEPAIEATAGDVFWPKAKVIEVTSLGRTALADQVKAGQFPAPRNLGGRKIAWLRSEILAWMRNRPTG